jgi:hypothetical protein
MRDTGLVRYDAMCHAIAEAHQIDEVKDLRDKAMALEHYARQAQNLDAERKACEIRLRAERRAGELLREQAANGERAADGRPKLSRDATILPKTLPDLGISRDQSSKWQKLADVPEDQFEDALRDPVTKPSTASIIRKLNGDTQKMNPAALWIWGRMRDFERDRIDNVDPRELSGEMTETMAADMRRILPSAIDYLSQLQVYFNE